MVFIRNRQVMFFIIILMIFFSLIKNAGWSDGSDDPAFGFIILFGFIKHAFSDLLLFFIQRKDHRAILRALGAAIIFAQSCVMKAEKGFQDLTIADLCRIKLDSYSLNMPGIVLAYIAIGRVFQMTTRITYLSIQHARQGLVSRFHTPETTTCYNRCLTH